MSQAHEVLRTLLSNIPLSEFSNDDQRATFDAIRQRLTASADLESELKTLYKVRNFSDFASTLMWVADRAGRGGSPAGPEETSLLLSTFRSAMGDSTPPAAVASLAPDSDNPFAAFGGGEPVQSSGMPVTEEQPSNLEGFGSVAQPDMQGAPGFPDTGMAISGDEKQFSALLEQFVEAMQSGEESRAPLLQQVVATCSVIEAGDFEGDYKEYCRYLAEFLTYISLNQFLDDVRVMNILSNVSSPVSQWANTAPAEREGLLEEGIAPLRDFKSLFE